MTALRASTTRARVRRVVAAVGVLVVLGSRAPRVVTADGGASLVRVDEIVAAYAHDPVRHRAALAALARRTDVVLPPAVVLMAGDAALRSGATRTAVDRFEQALAGGLDEPWRGWTRLALGWIALTREDLDEARVQFAAAADSPPSHAAAEMALGLIAASARAAGAAERFAAVAHDGGAEPTLREAAVLGRAYAQYWGGDYDGARMAFRAIADRAPASALADDARYAAAWMAVHAGAWAEAVDELDRLAAGTSGPRESAPRALLNLEPRALVQAGIHRYRRGPLAAPDRQLARLLDGNGVRLARAALRWIEAMADARASPREPLARPWSVQPVPERARARAEVPRAIEPVGASGASARGKPREHGLRPVVIGIAIVALVLGVVLRRAAARRKTVS